MQKSKFISILAAGLLVSNIILLIFIVKGPQDAPPPHQGSGGPRDIIIERLHFTPEQVQQYDMLIQAHRTAVNESDNRIMMLKNRLYNLLTNTSISPERDSLINALAQAQHDIELIHYKHFEDIQLLCTTDQKQDFKVLATELSGLFSHPRLKHRPH